MGRGIAGPLTPTIGMLYTQIWYTTGLRHDCRNNVSQYHNMCEHL